MKVENGLDMRSPPIWSDTGSSTRPFAILKDAISIEPKAALQGLWWFIRGKRQRSCNTLIAAAARHPYHYRRFLSAQKAALAKQLATESNEQVSDLIAVVVPQPGSTADDEAVTVTSLQIAFGIDLDIYRCGGGKEAETADEGGEMSGRTIAAIAKAHQSAWAIIIAAGDTISQQAGSIVRRAIATAGGASLVYWDEDVLRGSVHSDPWLKPEWDELIYFARDCLTGSCALRLSAPMPAATSAGEALELRSWAALLSQLAATSDVAPFHLAAVLTHRASPLPTLTLEERTMQLSNAWGELISMSELPGTEVWCLTEFESLGEWPGVSIIIPSKNQATLLRACLDSLDRLAYQGSVEIILVDNGSSQPDAMDLLATLEARNDAKVLRAPGPFNFSSLVNLAAQSASHPFLCLLNNDVEATCGDWLAKMMVQAARPGVGAVGAQLLYPDGTIQHAGVVIGIGGAAGHFAKGVDPSLDAHRSWFGVTRQVSAVTAACLVVSKEKYMSVGGLDEQNLRVAFNDVDLCLKLERAGYRNVYVAEARLIHHESKSRGLDLSPENAERFACEEAVLKSRWGTDKYMDPCFNPQFTRRLESIAFSLWSGDSCG